VDGPYLSLDPCHGPYLSLSPGLSPGLCPFLCHLGDLVKASVVVQVSGYAFYCHNPDRLCGGDSSNET